MAARTGAQTAGSKSEYSLRLIESYSVGTGRSALYEVLLDPSEVEEER